VRDEHRRRVVALGDPLLAIVACHAHERLGHIGEVEARLPHGRGMRPRERDNARKHEARGRKNIAAVLSEELDRRRCAGSSRVVIAGDDEYLDRTLVEPPPKDEELVDPRPTMLEDVAGEDDVIDAELTGEDRNAIERVRVVV
jgi:hypothetical protein